MRKIIKILLLVSVVLVPFSPEIAVTPTIKMSLPIEILLPILSVLTLIFGLKEWKNWATKFTVSNIAVYFFFGMLACSIVSSSVPISSIKAVAVFGLYCSSFYFAPKIIRFTASEWKQLWDIYLLTFGAALLYALVNYLRIGIGYSESYRFAEPFSVGHTLFMSIGFPAFILAIDEQIRTKTINWRTPILVLYIIFMLISYSRFYWVLLLLFGFFFVYKYFKQLRLILLVGSLAVSVSSVFIYQKIDKERNIRKAWLSPEDHKSVFRQITGIFKMDYNESNRERINRLRVGIEMFKENPMNGLGFNTYADKFYDYSEKIAIDFTSKSDYRMNAHILYIGWLVELGVMGLLGGLFLMGTFLWIAVRLRKTPMGFAFTLIAINYILLGIIEDYFLLETVIPGFWLSYAYVSSTLTKDSSNLEVA